MTRRLRSSLALAALLLACDSRTPAPIVTAAPAAGSGPSVTAAPVAGSGPSVTAAPVASAGPSVTAAPVASSGSSAPIVTASPGTTSATVASAGAKAEPAPPPAPPPDAKTPRFSRACAAGETITIAAVGDLLLHHELQIQAYASPDNFLAVWGGVSDLLARADLAYANLEGPTAPGLRGKGQPWPDPGRTFDRRVYSSYPRFNYHPSLLADLLKSGVDVVSTANNHALDRGPGGVDRTITALDAAGLPHTGTRAAGASGPWHTITRARGITVAWLACAHHTNQIEDPHAQVLRCYEPKGALERLAAALVADPKIDAVIVTPHWGKEYTPAPERAQQQLAARLAAVGVTAIVGSHPHVLQPWEALPGPDGREMLVMYSLGNFASHQPELPRRSSMVLYLGLTRPPGQKAHVHGVRYVPLHVRQDGERYFVEAIDRVGGPADSRALTVEMFGEAALLGPDAPLVTRPACP